MKKLILAAIAVTCAVSVFAQGTVTFNNRVVGSIITHVYAPLGSDSTAHQIGNGPTDFPAGTTAWTAYTLIGVANAGQYGATTTLAQLLAAPGNSQPEASLVPMSGVAAFRSGVAAGFINGTTSIANNVAPDGAATLEMVAWDNSSGLYPTWTQASVAWKAGAIAAGTSGTWNAVLGGTGTPPFISGAQSFNLFTIGAVPEPSTFALAGLGLAAMLVLRRRK